MTVGTELSLLCVVINVLIKTKTDRDDRFQGCVLRSVGRHLMTYTWSSMDHFCSGVRNGIRTSPISSISGIAPCLTKHMLFTEPVSCYSICCQAAYCSLLYRFSLLHVFVVCLVWFSFSFGTTWQWNIVFIYSVIE